MEAERLEKNPTFQKRWLNFFDTADKNKDGVLTLDEFMKYGETLKTLTGRKDEEMEPLREAMRKLYVQFGTVEEGAKREEWVHKISIIAAAELERIEKKEPTQLGELLRVFFSLVDINDDNTLSREEFAIFCKCYEWPEEIVPIFFDMADTNHNGKLEWDEFYNIVFNFWYKVEEGKIDNAYGGYF